MTERDRYGPKWTEETRSGQKRKETDRNKQKQTETDQSGKKQTETDSLVFKKRLFQIYFSKFKTYFYTCFFYLNRLE